MRGSPLDAPTVWTALNQTIIKGLEYPLAATTLTESQISVVMSPILNSVLPRAGFSRTFPRAVVYSPKELQGLGVTNLWDFQFCWHIQDIVDQTWRDTPTGKLIVANLEAASPKKQKQKATESTTTESNAPTPREESPQWDKIPTPKFSASPAKNPYSGDNKDKDVKIVKYPC